MKSDARPHLESSPSHGIVYLPKRELAMARFTLPHFRSILAMALVGGVVFFSELVRSPQPTASAQEKAKPASVAAGGGNEVIATINQKLAEGWKANKLTPSTRCTDYEFIRRASLDIIGRIAKPEEIARFM